MALTITTVDKFVIGDRTQVIADIVFDSSYPAGGEAVTAADFGLRNSITHITAGLARDPDTVDNAVALDYDAAAGTIVAFWGDYSSATDGVLLEVANTTSLAAYTARVTVIGK